MPIRVLLVDDVEDVRHLVQSRLELHHTFEVIAEVGTGQGAVEAARLHQPDIVVLDLGLPDWAGADVLSQLRVVAPDAKVVVFTGLDSSAEILARRSADGFVLKNADLGFLIAVLEEVATASPLVATLELDSDPATVAVARQFVAERCVTWGCDVALDAAVLVTSELVTNAIVHARSAARLCIRRRLSAVRIDVTDSGVTSPQPRNADQYDESGRGLLLVSAMAAAWGVEPIATGKIVWAELPCGEIAKAAV